MFLGPKIRAIREARGWSSGELARRSGISRAYLWQLETGGKDKPSIEIIEKLAQTLEVSVSEFSDAEEPAEADADSIPVGLAEFFRERGRQLGVTKGDVKVMKGVHFRGGQPEAPEDWELLFLFLRKWGR